MERITQSFPDWRVEDPDQPQHSAGYRRCAATGQPMDYFLNEVLPGCDGGIFLAFHDGRFGAGVYLEARTLADAGKPIWEIKPDGGIVPLVLSPDCALTVEETRRRIRDKDGLRPYQLS